MIWPYLLLALVAGAMLPIQAGVNARLARQTNSPVLAALISFAIGMLALVALSAALRPPLPPTAALARAPWWAWLGGLLGAYFIAASIVAAPRLGAALFVAVVIAGQVMIALALDHFGLLGYAARPLTLWRAAGAALLLLGVWMIRKN